MAQQSDPEVLRRWRRACVMWAACMVVLGAAVAIAGVFTTSHRPQDIGGPGLYFVGGGVAAAGIAIAIITDWLGRHYGVRKRKRPSPIDWPWSRQ